MKLKQNAYKPISFWSWNGKMEEIEIRRQIGEFQKAGYGGFFIHSRAGRTIPYMEEEWFVACRYAIEEAKNCGLDVWLYDEDGWPSGFAGGKVNGCGEAYQGKSLRFSTGTPKDENARILATYRKDDLGTYHRIAVSEATATDLYGYYVPVCDYVDIMDHAVIAKFIEVTHEKYREAFSDYFGSVIQGIFTDEPQVIGSPAWSLCMEECYRQKYQEDILDSLWLLSINGVGYQAFRYRYWNCVNTLIQQNFAGQIQNWCKENHLAFTGHFSSEDGLIYQTKSNGGVMPLYKNMDIPGVDHLGNRYASPVLLKQVASVAHQQGKPYVLSESFGCAGWEVSFQELLGIVGWQAVMGVNTFCTHLSAYSMIGRRKRDYPAFYSYQEPWWDDCHLLFETIQTWCQAIGESRRDTKVAVMHPIRSVWCESGIEHGEEMKFLTAQFRILVENLLDVHVDFDLLDESDFCPEQVTDGVLTVGNVSYTHVIIPEATTVTKDTVATLEAISSGGGTVMFVNQRPHLIDGIIGHPLCQNIENLQAIDIQNTRAIWQKFLRVYPIQKDYQLLDLRMENEVTGVVSHYGKIPEGAVIFLFHPGIGHKTSMVLRHKGMCKVEALEPFGNQVKDITGAFDGEYTAAEITMEPQSGFLLRILNAECHKPAEREEVVSKNALPLVKVIPTQQNALTLDMGSLCINGGDWSEKKALIHQLDELYQNLGKLREDAVVSVKYIFYAEFKKVLDNMQLALEMPHVQSILVNGQRISPTGEWWIDREIGLYDMQGVVKNGGNEVIVTYHIPKSEKAVLSEDALETEVNRFFYDVEPESIYVCGAFDVGFSDGEFVLRDVTQKQMGNLTEQGMPFYRGSCVYEGEWVYDGQSKLMVCLENIEGTAVKVSVNDKFVGLIAGNEGKLEVTTHMQKGNNRIQIELLGHNRNLLGPHHHKRGKLYFVGPNSFEGTWGFADFVNPDIEPFSKTWTDEYHFIPFGIKQIYIETLKGDM